MSDPSPLDNPYEIPDLDDDDILQTPRPQHIHLLHTRQLSLGDPIGISILSPSTANLSPRSEASPLQSPLGLTPSRPPSIQLSVNGNELSAPTDSSGHNDGASLCAEPHQARFAVEDESSTSSRRRARGVEQQSSFPPSAYFAAEGQPIRQTFTAVDPFARRKHRLSWSSILSVKDGKNARRANPPDAWTTPVEGPDDFDGHDADSTEVIYDRTSQEEGGRFGQQQTSPEADSNSHNQSSSSKSSYHSFDEEREKEKVRKAAPYHETIYPAPPQWTHNPAAEGKKHPAPSIHFSRQPTETIPEGVFYPSPGSDELQPISILALISSYLPRRMYLYFLLGVPGLYFTRVATVFEDANIHGKALERMVLDNATARRYPGISMPNDHPAFKRLTKSWTQFIDTLIREWKTFNIISVLLLSAIVAILQIEPAFQDPIVHYSALFSLVSALMSLLFGCMYILRFNTMRMPHKAVQWAQETQKTHTNMFWNVWILLAIPAVWLVWSLLFYIVCIMAFVWRVDSDKPPPAFTNEFVLAIRIGISIALGVGIVYIIVVLRTFINFGAPMDRRFKKKLEEHLHKHYSGNMFHRIKRSETYTSNRDRPPAAKDRTSAVRPEWISSLPFPDDASVNRMSAGSKYSSIHLPEVSVPFMPIGPIVDKSIWEKHTQVHFKPSLDGSTSPAPPAITVSDVADPKDIASWDSQHASAPASTPGPTDEAPSAPSPIPIPTPPPTYTPVRPPMRTRTSSKPLPARRVLQPHNAAASRKSQNSMDKTDPKEDTSAQPIAQVGSSTSGRGSQHSKDRSSGPPSSDNEESIPGTQPRPQPPPDSQVLEPQRPRVSSTTSQPSDDGPIYFGVTAPRCSSKYECFSMHSSHPVVCDGVIYPSSALALSARREDCQDDLGQEGGLVELAVSLDDVQTLKFQQNPAIARVLLQTGQREIVYWDPGNLEMGSNGHGEGRNELGRALMRVRERIRVDRSAQDGDLTR